MLTTECLVAERPKDDKDAGAGAMPGTATATTKLLHAHGRNLRFVRRAFRRGARGAYRGTSARTAPEAEPGRECAGSGRVRYRVN